MRVAGGGGEGETESKHNRGDDGADGSSSFVAVSLGTSNQFK